jgi:hypothetical protein
LGKKKYVPIHGTKFAPTNGQVTVRSKFVLVHETVKGTIHGLDLIFLIFHFHGFKHALLVKVKMPRSLPQIQVGNMRCVDNVIAIILMSLLPEILNLTTNGGSLWMPKDESATGILLRRITKKYRVC